MEMLKMVLKLRTFCGKGLLNIRVVKFTTSSDCFFAQSSHLSISTIPTMSEKLDPKKLKGLSLLLQLHSVTRNYSTFLYFLCICSARLKGRACQEKFGHEWIEG